MLSTFVDVVHELKEASITSGEIIGDISVTADNLKSLQDLIEARCMETFVISMDRSITLDKVTFGTIVKITLYPPRIPSGKFYNNLQTLINTNKGIYPTHEFYVHEIEFMSNSEQKPKVIENYQNVTKLIAFLKEMSNYAIDDEIIYFQGNPLAISIDYQASDLQELDGLDFIISHINDSVDKEERKTIFINEVIQLLFNTPDKSVRLKALISSFPDLVLNYKNSYQLYLERYSYQKFKSELTKELLEYSRKIQAVVNDAQGKLVAIPAAFLLVASQLELGGENIFKNFSITFGVVIFSYLIDLLVESQLSSLSFIGDDLDRFEATLGNETKQLFSNNTIPLFEEIRIANSNQKKRLWSIRFLTWFPTVYSILFLFYSAYIDSNGIVKLYIH